MVCRKISNPVKMGVAFCALILFVKQTSGIFRFFIFFDDSCKGHCWRHVYSVSLVCNIKTAHCFPVQARRGVSHQPGLERRLLKIILERARKPSLQPLHWSPDQRWRPRVTQNWSQEKLTEGELATCTGKWICTSFLYNLCNLLCRCPGKSIQHDF